jgi:hypothetical protein
VAATGVALLALLAILGTLVVNGIGGHPPVFTLDQGAPDMPGGLQCHVGS